jgi:hypothetical protein
MKRREQMKRKADLLGMFLLAVAVMLAISPAMAQTDPLPSWNDGSAKKAIIEFV